MQAVAGRGQRRIASLLLGPTLDPLLVSRAVVVMRRVGDVL